jgi:glycogen debranching enzyme
MYKNGQEKSKDCNNIITLEKGNVVYTEEERTIEITRRKEQQKNSEDELGRIKLVITKCIGRIKKMKQEEIVEAFKQSLTRINLPFFKEYDDDISSIVTNVCNLAKYERVDSDGPKRGPITFENPIIYPYFAHIKAEGWEETDYLSYLHSFTLYRPHILSANVISSPVVEDEFISGTPTPQGSSANLATSPDVESVFSITHANYFLGIPAVCNGWVFGSDPTADFASPLSRAYVRREVVIWSDNLKLNYGPKPDCLSKVTKLTQDEDAPEVNYDELPYLWNHMRKYTEWCAKLFHGIRLDNAHSTPLHVSEFLIDCARKVNPNLFAFAELFTHSKDTEVDYCARLGLSALLKEAINKKSSNDLGFIFSSPIFLFLLF